MSNLIRVVWTGTRLPYRNVVIPNRNISRTFPRREKPSITGSSETATKHDAVSSLGTMTHLVKPYHKYALVWAGKYKSVAEVPERVAHGVLDNALNKARIKISIYMMIGTILMAGVAVYNGKKAVARGDSLAKQGVEYHKQLREQGVKEKETTTVGSTQ